MLSCSATLSSTTRSRRRRGCAKSFILASASERRLRRCRLDYEGECAARQCVLPILVERYDLHRDMTSEWVLLELAQHVPSEHVGQEHVERYRCRLILFGKIEGIVAAHRQQHLKPLVAGEVDNDARIMRIVFDDQQEGIAGLKIEPVVRDLLERAVGGGRQQLGGLDAGSGGIDCAVERLRMNPRTSAADRA